MAGNWKMYKTPAETTAFFEKFRGVPASGNDASVVIFPPFIDITSAVEATRGSQVGIGAQNLYWGTEGAFTGEVCGRMIRAAGCTHVLIGHSERRQFFGETDATVYKRCLAALDADLMPIVCLGERLEERESGRTEAVLQEQFANGIAVLTPEQFARIVIAYEPVWAIGTGKTATPEIAGAAHAVIRAQVAGRFGQDAANQIRILYGGSVKPDNVKSLMAQTEIDGVLVGGASLDPASFAAIVNYA